MSVEIDNESGVEVDQVSLAAAARFTLDRMRIHPLAELSLLLVDVATMEHLHVTWMDAPGPTDVLSFPMDELRPPDEEGEAPEGLLGDVVICPDVAQKQADAAGHPLADELELLCVHGILHLLGYDHGDPEEEKEMFGLQAELLRAWRGTPERAVAGGGVLP